MTVVSAVSSRVTSPQGAEQLRVAHQTRRTFLFHSLGLLVTAVSLPVLTLSAARTLADMMPDAADLEIAALGGIFRESQPAEAARTEAWVRKAVGLSGADRIDWGIADRARLMLTERARIAAELDREDVVFVDGWLLAKSEAGVTLFYAAAKSQSTPAVKAR